MHSKFAENVWEFGLNWEWVKAQNHVTWPTKISGLLIATHERYYNKRQHSHLKKDSVKVKTINGRVILKLSLSNAFLHFVSKLKKNKQCWKF